MPDDERELDPESARLEEEARREKNWKRWGPYLSERQWGTVREDYSADFSPWTYFPHEQAHARAYRWGEDGLLGFTDRQCRLCFAVALWNGRDPILKERLFGLTNPQGNHGEDVKECYHYLDSTPTHSYARALYRYPQAAFPYEMLVEANAQRGKVGEFELTDTGVFDEGRYFDVQAEYAKASPNDVLIRLTVWNRGPEAAPLRLLPTLWFRNTWQWGCAHEGCTLKPLMKRTGPHTLTAEHETLGRFRFIAGPAPDGAAPAWLFTDNHTNNEVVFGAPNTVRFTRDAFHRCVVSGERSAVSAEHTGTKAAPQYALEIPAGGSAVVKLRLWEDDGAGDRPLDGGFDAVFEQRIAEAERFYARRLPGRLSDEQRLIARQACAGLLWSKQFYHYIIEDWLRGDAHMPPPPAGRARRVPNRDWFHFYSRDVLSVPDKWEYPWFAAWDLAFHTIPLCRIDPAFAKRQLLLLLREWYTHPNGQMPAYEYNLCDVNPPVHAWACWRVYKMTGPRGRRDVMFLARCFQKLMLNFTWWVNRKDPGGRNVFAGGFLGLDNIGVFDRSRPLPTGGRLEQADGTAWMAFFCGTMLSMALELARHDRSYEDIASKFFEHYILIADAMNTVGGGLWDEEDGFYYDQLLLDGRRVPLRVRSLVGLIALCAAEIIEGEALRELPGFRKRTDWFLKYRADLADQIAWLDDRGDHERLLLAIPSRPRLERVLRYLLDEREFLSPFGVRSLSRFHEQRPYVLTTGDAQHRVAYEPGESGSDLFGGNSNWRGPVWLPLNYLIVEALQRYDYFYGDELLVECPAGSGRRMNLRRAAAELCRRLVGLFTADERGRRPCHGDELRYAEDPHWRGRLLFHEYFHAETGRGLGASHQTGWTALIVNCLHKLNALGD